jgi:hypothetical protein
MNGAPDPALLDLLDLIQRENVRFIEALERVARDLSALGARATAAGEALAGVSSRLTASSVRSAFRSRDGWRRSPPLPHPLLRRSRRW